ncbi:MAG TPA: hypothetical protein VGP25_18015 [Gemmatimonadaceae bacterium]|jgi:hypothetical protein|nr:hypothetical protein [Gemmatimonadaceae bacterium]
MSRIRNYAVAGITAALAFAACKEPSTTGVVGGVRNPSGRALDRSSSEQAAAQRVYGTPVTVGKGTVRTYITFDKKEGGKPIEVGVAMSDRSMEGLPTPDPMPMAAGEKGHDHAAMVMNMYLLDLPKGNPTQYRFVQFDWNPLGHEPAGVYDLPHFDFHFYTVSKEVRASILPTDPQFEAKAANYPAPQFRSPFYIDAATPAQTTPAGSTVPQMGLHWLDVRSPELQGMAGNPAGFKPFTKTFIYGSWDGQFIFDEPMITRAYILEKKRATDPAVIDEVIPVSTAQRYSPAGYYPSAYRITWDAQAREYRIALTQLSYHE